MQFGDPIHAAADGRVVFVGLASPVLNNGHHADLYTLAEDIVISQGKEIKQMDEWLDAWYGVKRPVWPAPGTTAGGGARSCPAGCTW